MAQRLACQPDSLKSKRRHVIVADMCIDVIQIGLNV